MPVGRKRIMREFILNEISAVDHPAQKGARMTIIKRGGDPDLIESITKRYIDPADGAVPFTTVLRNNLESERFYAATKPVEPAIYALDCTVRSIAGDANLARDDKLVAMRVAVEEFLQAARNGYPEVDAIIEKVMKAEAEGEDPMKTDAQKIADLETQVGDLTKQLKAGADVQKSLDETTAKLTELTTKMTALETEKTELAAKAAMSDAEKKYAGTLSDKEKAAFMAMKPDERKKAMAKREENDEVIKVGDQEIRKSVVGESQFAVIKSQEDRIAKQAKDLADQQDATLTATLTKRADDEFKHLPGETTVKVSVLKAVGKMEKAERDALETMLTAGEKAISAAYGKIGHKNAGKEPVEKGEGAQTFRKKVDEIVATEKVSRNVALAKARELYPKEFEAYQGATADQTAN